MYSALDVHLLLLLAGLHFPHASLTRGRPNLIKSGSTTSPHQISQAFSTLPNLTVTTAIQFAQPWDESPFREDQIEPITLSDKADIHLTLPTIVNYNFYIQSPSPPSLAQPGRQARSNDRHDDDEDEDEEEEEDDDWEAIEEILEALELSELLRDLDLTDSAFDIDTDIDDDEDEGQEQMTMPWSTDESLFSIWDEWISFGWASSTSAAPDIYLSAARLDSTSSTTDQTSSSAQEADLPAASTSTSHEADSMTELTSTSSSDETSTAEEKGSTVDVSTAQNVSTTSPDVSEQESSSSSSSSSSSESTASFEGLTPTETADADSSHSASTMIDTSTQESSTPDTLTSSSDQIESTSSTIGDLSTLEVISVSSEMENISTDASSSTNSSSTTDMSTIEEDDLLSTLSGASVTSSNDSVDRETETQIATETETETETAGTSTHMSEDETSSSGEESESISSSTSPAVHSDSDATSSASASDLSTSLERPESPTSDVDGASTSTFDMPTTSSESLQTETREATADGSSSTLERTDEATSTSSSSFDLMTSDASESTSGEVTSVEESTLSTSETMTSGTDLTTSGGDAFASLSTSLTSSDGLTSSPGDEVTTSPSRSVESSELAAFQTSDWRSSSSGPMESEESASARVLTSMAAEPLGWLPVIDMHTLMPLEALVIEKDLSLLGGAVKTNDKYEVLRKVGMTIFAPVNSAFDGIPMDIEALTAADSLKAPRSGTDANRDLGGDRRLRQRSNVFPRRDPDLAPRRQLGRANHFADEPVMDCEPGSACEGAAASVHEFVELQMPAARKMEQKDVLADFEKLIMFHVVRRVVPPGMIEARKSLSLKSEMRGRSLSVEVVADANGLPQVRVNGVATVLAIVKCRNGYIYKVDQPLFPPFNLEQPTLVDAIKTNKHFSKLRYLMEQSGIFDNWAAAGPITMLLIPDEAWKVDGLPVPPCFFKALVRPENAEILTKLLRWTTIPGLWTRADIQRAEWLPNGAAPSLSVTHVDMPKWNATQALRQEALESRQDLYDSFIQHPHTVKQASNLPHPETDPASFDPRIVTLVEGKEIVIWDIAFYNGFGHTVSELPLRPDLDLRSILWDCLDSLCFECPIVTKFLLKYLDGGGLLPDVTNPKAYIVPPGVRPDWVCSGAEHWFPPGWDHHDWQKYVETAKSGNARLAHNLAYSGWRRAAIRSADLEDKLHEAEIHLRKIWHLYGDPSNYVLGSREDPNLLIGWIRNRRSLEVKPRVCDPKGGKRPGASLDIWEGTDNWDDKMSYSPRDSFVAKIDRDRQRKFGMEDLRYVTQWI